MLVLLADDEEGELLDMDVVFDERLVELSFDLVVDEIFDSEVVLGDSVEDSLIEDVLLLELGVAEVLLIVDEVFSVSDLLDLVALVDEDVPTDLEVVRDSNLDDLDVVEDTFSLDLLLLSVVCEAEEVGVVLALLELLSGAGEVSVLDEVDALSDFMVDEGVELDLLSDFVVEVLTIEELLGWLSVFVLDVGVEVGVVITFDELYEELVSDVFLDDDDFGLVAGTSVFWLVVLEDLLVSGLLLVLEVPDLLLVSGLLLVSTLLLEVCDVFSEFEDLVTGASVDE